MKRSKETRNQQRRRSARGFSMTEMIIALAIAAIAAAGIYSVYVSQQKQSSSTRLYNDLQNDLRFAMDYMKNELYLAGYRARNTVTPISVATAGDITFEYFDENVQTDSDYTPNIQVKYYLQENPVGSGLYDLRRLTKQWHSTLVSFQNSPYITPVSTLATNVTSLVFSYRKGDNAPFVIGTDSLEDIRTIRISLSGRSRRADATLKDPVTGGDYYRTLTLTGEVMSRNVAISSNPYDTTPPNVPQGLKVWDPGACGRLGVAWTANSEPDLAGYTIFYGVTPGVYVGKARIGRAPGSGTETYTLTGIESNDTEFYVAVSAFDRSANASALSAEEHGDPDPDLRTLAAVAPGSSDSTINPDVPAPPTNLAASTPADGEVHLSWTPSATPGIEGYRLFRAAQADFSDEAMIADYLDLPPDSTGFVDGQDPADPLVGCRTYYYRIASIHCDPTIFPADYTFTAVGAVDDDYASVSATPTDTVPPTTPLLVARAGYLRVILNLKNPDRAAEPDFDRTEIWFSTAGFPAIDAAPNALPSSGAPIPDRLPLAGPPGTFTGSLSVPPQKFDSETLVNPPQPELDENSPYYFIAVAYDRCGNHTEVTDDASDVGVQCGDCDATEVCFEAPPAPTGITKSACNSSISLTWNSIDDILYRDLAGFRVWREEVDVSGIPVAGTEVELTGGAATWFTDWSDTPWAATNPIQLGKAYNYQICAVDCYYEQHADPETIPWPDPTNDPKDNLNCTAVNNLYLARIQLSPSRPVPVTGDIFALSPNMRHNAVTTWFDNLAAGNIRMVWNRSSWIDTDDYVYQYEVGDGSTTSEEIVAQMIPAWASGDNVYYFFSDGQGKIVDTLDQEVPQVGTFTHQDGSVDANVDLRLEKIDMVRAIRNLSTINTCVYAESFRAPLGPVVSGVTQDSPDNPTLSWPVPGPAGGNFMDLVVVPGGVDVNVTANVRDTSFVGLDPVLGARLYYYIDVGALLPGPPDQSSFDPGDYIPMSVLAGSYYKTDNPIPANDGNNVWYYILAVDANGNFDREPELDAGAFQYFQQPADVCSNVPKPPTALLGSTTATTVTLTWTAPTENNDNSPLNDLAGYRVYRSDGGGFAFLATVNAGTLTYIDTLDAADLAANNYSYYVTAFDSCADGALESVTASNIYTECVGAPDCIFNVTASAGLPMTPGDTLAVELTVCAKQAGGPLDTGPGEIVYMQSCSGAGDADPIQMREQGDTGYFTIVPQGGRDTIKVWRQSLYPGAPTNLDLWVDDSGNDTVTLSSWWEPTDPFVTGGTIDGTCASAAQASCSQQDFPVVAVPPPPPDPCAGQTAPDAVPDLVIAVPDCNSYTADLTWNAPASGADFYRVFECSVAGCTPDVQVSGDIAATTFSRTGAPAKYKNGVFRYHVQGFNSVGGLCPPLGGPPSLVVEDACL